MDLTSKLQRMLKTTTGNSLDVACILFKEFLSKSESPEVLLKLILEYPSNIGVIDDNAPTEILESEVSDFLSQYYELINVTLKSIINKNPSIEDFYKKLYNYIFKSDLLPQDDKSQSILLYLLYSKKFFGIPYYQATDLLKMDDDVYKKTIEDIEREISLAIYMLNRHFESRTEEISQLVNIAAELDTKEKQVVFWSVIISFIRHVERIEALHNTDED